MSFRDFFGQIRTIAELRFECVNPIGSVRYESHETEAPDEHPSDLSASDRFIQHNEGLTPLGLIKWFVRESIPEVFDAYISDPHNGFTTVSGEFGSNYGSWELEVHASSLESVRLSDTLTEAVQKVSAKLQEAKEMQEIRRNFEELDRINIFNGVYSQDDCLFSAHEQARAHALASMRSISAGYLNDEILRSLRDEHIRNRGSGFDASANQAIAETYKLQERCRGCQNRNRDFDGYVAPEHLRDLKCAINPVYAMDGVGECADFEADNLSNSQRKTCKYCKRWVRTDEEICSKHGGGARPLCDAPLDSEYRRLLFASLINRLQSIPGVQTVDIEAQMGVTWCYEILVYIKNQGLRRFGVTETSLRSSMFAEIVEEIIARVMEGDC